MKKLHVRVKVTPGAKKEVVERIDDHSLFVHVKEKAERNEANIRVIALVADEFNVSPHRVRLIRGHKTPNKMFEIITE